MERTYYKGEFEVMPQIEMTKAELKAISKDYKGTRVVDGHRVRVVLSMKQRGCVFLTDSKEHPAPTA